METLLLGNYPITPLFKPLQHYHHIYGEKQSMQSYRKTGSHGKCLEAKHHPQVPILCTAFVSYSLDLLCRAHCPLQAANANAQFGLMLDPRSNISEVITWTHRWQIHTQAIWKWELLRPFCLGSIFISQVSHSRGYFAAFFPFFHSAAVFIQLV